MTQRHIKQRHCAHNNEDGWRHLAARMTATGATTTSNRVMAASTCMSARKVLGLTKAPASSRPGSGIAHASEAQKLQYEATRFCAQRHKRPDYAQEHRLVRCVKWICRGVPRNCVKDTPPVASKPDANAECDRGVCDGACRTLLGEIGQWASDTPNRTFMITCEADFRIIDSRAYLRKEWPH